MPSTAHLAVLHLAFVTVANAKLVAAAVLPHGDFAFDPSLLAKLNPASQKLSEALHAGSVEAGRLLTLAQPDVVILSTPHGLQASWDLAVYQNAKLDGKAAVGRDLEESYGRPYPTYDVSLSARTDTQLAQQIHDGLDAAHRNVTLLRGWNGVLPLPLHWGEVLALEYLVPHTTRDGGGAGGGTGGGGGARELTPSLVALGLPLSRYNHSSSVAAGFRAMGQTLGTLVEALPARVALVVSTDLAHRHWPNTSFGYSPYAAPFDAAIGKWAATLDPKPLFVDSAAHVDEIYSCGWLGLLLLHGALEAAAAAAAPDSAAATAAATATAAAASPGGTSGASTSSNAAPLNASWTPLLTAAPAHPTYYGMMASVYTRVIAMQVPTALMLPVCPVGNHACPQGCAPLEAGNATCCGDGTACASGYACAEKRGVGAACVAANSSNSAAAAAAAATAAAAAAAAVAAASAAVAAATTTTATATTAPKTSTLTKPEPMGTAGWELRYHLCSANLTLHTLELPAPTPGGTTLRFPYYSTGGALGAPTAAGARAEMALIVQHGANRNADDYFCAGVQAAAMAGYGNGRALVLAPRFMEPADQPTQGLVWWNGSYPQGCWRCGAESDPSSSATGRTVSSYAVLDAMVTALQQGASRGSYPRLDRVTLAGHSSGGQIVQRHAIFTRLPPPTDHWPTAGLSRGAATAARGAATGGKAALRVRHVPGNPSSYAYLSPRRWRGLSDAPGNLLVPDSATRAACPDYDDWHFGLSARLPPFVRAAPGGVESAVRRFAARDVTYLQGYNDTCACNPGDGCQCVSHGLEVTCSDELMGTYRLQRGRLYYAHLTAHYGRRVHAMKEVANVGHDHTLLWQSKEGLEALFGR